MIERYTEKVIVTFYSKHVLQQLHDLNVIVGHASYSWTYLMLLWVMRLTAGPT